MEYSVFDWLRTARQDARQGRIARALEIYSRLLPEPPADSTRYARPKPLTAERLAALPEPVRAYVDPVLSICRRLPSGWTNTGIRMDLDKGDMPAVLAGLADACRTHLAARDRRRSTPAENVEKLGHVRLGVRAVPEDLRALLLAYWAREPKAGRVFEFWELDFLDPHEGTWLDDLIEADADGAKEPPRDADGIAGAAIDAGYREVARHAGLVGTWNNNSLFGYWLHPGERFDEFPPVIQIDREGEIRILSRDCSVTEALTGTTADGDDERFDQLARLLRDAGIPVERRGRCFGLYGDATGMAVRPEVLFEEVRAREAERLTAELAAARQLLRRSGTVVEATDLLGVLGTAADAPAVAGLLTTLGLPAVVEFRADDIARTVADPVRGVELTFQRVDEIRDERQFGVAADAPITAVVTFVEGGTFAGLPHELCFGQSTEAVRELLGQPLKENTYQRNDTWEIDRRYVRVSYSPAGTVERVAVGLPWKGFP
jgi:hypothetical protein